MKKVSGLFPSILCVVSLTACGPVADGQSSTPEAADTAAVEGSGQLSQSDIDRLAETLKVTYQVIANKAAECQAGGRSIGATSCYEAKITLHSDEPVTASGWEIYFSQPDPLAFVAPGALSIDHINGDLHVIRPGEEFETVTAQAPVSADLVVRGQVLSEAKLMPNWYVVADGLEARTIDSTRMQTDPETGLLVRPWIVDFPREESHYRKGPGDDTPLATSAFLHDANSIAAPVDNSSVAAAIIPSPASVQRRDGALDLAAGLTVSMDGVDRAAIDAALQRLALFGVAEAAGGVPVSVSVEPDLMGGTESYVLDIGPGAVAITAADDAGAAYALYSLASLVTLGETTVPQLRIEDSPRFGFRGMHIDLARNFHSLDMVLKVMDQMAAYKLNKLHLHLADDEGWRLEIPGLPELTDVGARRCHDPAEDDCLLMQLGSGPTGETEVDGYFSVADYSAILAAAKARHIEVIPSLDMPGHSRAAIKSMEARYRRFMEAGQPEQAREYLLTDFDDTTEYESIQFYTDNTLNVCMESTYHFIDTVITEIATIHEAAGVPLKRYHIGADETAGAWVESPVCQAVFEDPDNGIDDAGDLGGYFIERVANMVAAMDVIPGGWNDGMGHTDPDRMPETVQTNAWGVLPWGGATSAQQQANYGWEVILSIPDALYFDFPYEADPKEGGYYWAGRRVNTRKVFDFMPENLPVHAEFWKDPNEQPFTIDDTLQTDDNGVVTHAPLEEGVRFAGMQGQVWSETLPSDEMVLYMIFPRLLALAERAWHQAEWEVPYDYQGTVYSPQTSHFTSDMRAARDADWARFAAVLAEKELPKLDKAGIPYRIPTVGARLTEGRLLTNTIFPGLPVEMRSAAGEWQAVDGPVDVTGLGDGAIEVRARSADGSRAGRALTVGE
ncbi:family 20 glycosylhydrolase [Aquisalinus flavus]|uniref:beta-N-acetylhexosaminidase n=1 Tax=Aquisalinus flavus TaxID=1526572 RepID=A0A8J2V156_9PROT|nr:family 20 glycosylhydrolase [Aquisalinus flavus]MBD0427410.1 carbohydate-binding domain-containing protein [Aquisalinus flavus]UNE47213.1 family 20 glycosylhydrolase [Aquisalinus flavus]GGD00775.1 beta-N-acetylhexosaminidase [Aquisalinus flavus]